MNLNTITAKAIANKKILVRVDFNVPLKKSGDNYIVADDTRIKNAVETIKFLVKNSSQVILISHLGRPGGKFDLDLSLLPTATHLSELINQEILFTSLKEIIEKKPDNKLIMLDNLRFYPGEKKNDPHFAKKLASLAQIYVNESFSTSHRAHASVEAITHLLPSFAGFALEKEVKYLTELIEEPKKPFVVVVGGAKISDKVSAIKKLSQIADNILLGGGVSNNFLSAEGFDIAHSYMQDKPADSSKEKIDFVQFADQLLDENRQEFSLINNKYPIPKIVYPIDVLAGKSVKAQKSSTINLLAHDPQPTNHDLMFLDIGPKTIALYQQIIAQAKTIFWNGPMGVFENKEFSHGTKKIAKAIANSRAKSIIGGGDTIRAIDDLGMEKDYSYISTAGGASLELLSGKILPGIEPLIKK